MNPTTQAAQQPASPPATPNHRPKADGGGDDGGGGGEEAKGNRIQRARSNRRNRRSNRGNQTGGIRSNASPTAGSNKRARPRTGDQTAATSNARHCDRSPPTTSPTNQISIAWRAIRTRMPNATSSPN